MELWPQEMWKTEDYAAEALPLEIMYDWLGCICLYQLYSLHRTMINNYYILNYIKGYKGSFLFGNNIKMSHPHVYSYIFFNRAWESFPLESLVNIQAQDWLTHNVRLLKWWDEYIEQN